MLMAGLFNNETPDKRGLKDTVETGDREEPRVQGLVNRDPDPYPYTTRKS